MEQKNMFDHKPKSKKKIFDKRSIFFSVIILVMFGYIVYAINKVSFGDGNVKSNKKSGENIYRELGNKLKSEKIFDQAIIAYEKYLSAANIDSESKSNIYYIIGDMHYELQKYNEALAAYYTADSLGAPAIIKGDLNIKIVNCLERLGRDFSAEYALNSKTALDDKKMPDQPEGVVIAQIGDRKITMRDLDEKLEKLPPEAMKEYKGDPKKKFMFLQQYISTELLAKKAVKMGYDRDQDVLSKLDDAKKQLMIEKMVQFEFSNKVKTSPEDIKLYYDANKDKYKEHEAVKIAHILLATQEKADQVIAKLKSGSDFAQLAKTESTDPATSQKGGEVEGWLSLNQAQSDGVDRTALIKTALSVKEGEITPVVKDASGYHVLKVIAKRPARDRSFEEAAQEASKDYQLFKAEKIYRDMMEEILKVEGVKINQDLFFPKSDNQQGAENKQIEIKKIEENNIPKKP